jgi:hypothetical protein
MPSRNEEEPEETLRRQTATNPEDREQQMVHYADQLAERQLREGTASAQVITHYLKLGSAKEGLEREKIRHENLRLEAQVAQIKAQAGTAELYEKVLGALKIYTGSDEDDDDL